MGRLARLAFSEVEAEAMARDIEQIMEHVRALDTLDTSGVSPTAHGFDLATPLRPGRARLSRVPVATPFPEPTADAIPLVMLAAATGAFAATGAPPAVRLVAAAAPRAARVLVTALR